MKIQNTDETKILEFHPLHRPFLIRKYIVLSGVVAAIVGGLWGGAPLLGLTFYFVWVTLGDCLSHFVWKLKASAFSDEEELLKRQRVTGQELDRYFDTRRYIWMLSLLVASLVLGYLVLFGSFYLLPAFCLTYILCTVLGILGIRIFSKRRRPRLIYRDRQYDYPPPWIQPFPRTEPELMEPTYYRHLRGEIGTLWK